MIDPAGNRTSWVRDVQGREIYKIYPDQTTTAYQYEPATGRVKRSPTPKASAPTTATTPTAALTKSASGNALVPATPGGAFTYEPMYGRLATMTDGIGTTTNAYNPVPNAATESLGAGRLATVDGPWAVDTIGYGHDELGRIKTRQINGAANSTSYTYDPLGRIAGITTRAVERRSHPLRMSLASAAKVVEVRGFEPLGRQKAFQGVSRSRFT
ncbi:MAG TPA: hypothetical protein VIT91_21005 [Chthoniobacterales bacterium]